MGRSKFGAPKKVMQHGEFIDRIRKSLYYGVGTMESEMQVSGPLAEYAAELFSQPHRGHSLNRLTFVAAGDVHATPCSLIMALIYLDRLNLIDPGYSYARRITPQELFVVSLMISTKFYAGYDENFYFDQWADKGNMSGKKLKEMELQFLIAIDWNIYISNEQFFEKLSRIERILAHREGLRRGWLTYSELKDMLPSIRLMKFILNNIAVLALSYAASVITIAGAFFIASQVPGTLWYRRATPTAAMNATTVVPTPVDTSNVTQAAPVTSSMNTDTSITGIVINNGTASNDSCNALNVEAELLKLEQQYCAEARLNERKETEHELNDVRSTLPHNYRSMGHGQLETAKQWLNIKSEYSDHNHNLVVFARNDHWSRQNVSVFWQFLNDMMQQSFLIRWPVGVVTKMNINIT